MITKKVLSLIIILFSFSLLWSKDVIIVTHPAGQAFNDALKGMKDELAEDFEFKECLTTKKSSLNDFTTAINNFVPKVIILMDNSSVGLYGNYLKAAGADAPKIPVFALMCVLTDKAIAPFHNARGIAYEIPIVTSLINLREISKKSITTVGVISRSFMSDEITFNTKFCISEKFSLKSIKLKDDGDDSYYENTLSKALQILIDQKKIDVIWIPNDNVLLNSKLIKNIWVPLLSQSRIPAVMGVESLVNPAFNFGTFAVLPDHVALGSQAANIILDLRENQWVFNESYSKIEQPLSVFKIINLKQAEEYIKIKDGALNNIDKILK